MVRKINLVLVFVNLFAFFLGDVMACEEAREISVDGVAYNISQSFYNKGKLLLIEGDNGFFMRAFSSYIVISSSHRYGFICPLNDGNWPVEPFKLIDFSTGKVSTISFDYIPPDDIYCRILEADLKLNIEDTFLKKGFEYSMEGKLVKEYNLVEAMRNNETSNIIGSCM